MDFFDMGKMGDSALDAFLADPNLRELWFSDSDRLKVQKLLEERADKEVLRPSVPIQNFTSISYMSSDIEDMFMKFTIASDEMKAWVELRPSLKGTDSFILEELILDTLKRENITYGVRHQQIARLSQNPIYGTPIMVAQGKAPQEDKEGAVKFNFTTNPSLRPQDLENYSIDTENPDFVRLVKAGEILCTSTHSKNDFTGLTIRGEVVYPINGGLDTIEAGENVRMSSDGKTWFSTAHGEVILKNGVVSVYPILRLPQVDATTGDIDYNGSVYVDNTIQAGRVVKAAGNVVVGGIVEGCQLTVGGHLAVGKGIAGDDNSFIHVEGSVRTPFIEHMNMTIGGDMYVDVLLSSEIKCDGAVFALGRKGRIVGGCCIAREITANEIGNDACTKTVLEIPSMKQLQERLEQLHKEATAWTERKQKMQKVMRETNSDARKTVLEKVLLQIDEQSEETKMMAENLLRRIGILRAKYAFEIRAIGSLHPEVCCNIFGITLNVQRLFLRSRVFLGSNSLQVSQLSTTKY